MKISALDSLYDGDFDDPATSESSIIINYKEYGESPVTKKVDMALLGKTIAEQQKLLTINSSDPGVIRFAGDDEIPALNLFGSVNGYSCYLCGFYDDGTDVYLASLVPSYDITVDYPLLFYGYDDQTGHLQLKNGNGTVLATFEASVE